ncbi:MAG: polysaccharide deacetylase family protein [Lachnospiraceae bacterium]|nr:polysaccharide deacetylase family protein [Lachnospiraceae bacterium]
MGNVLCLLYHRVSNEKDSMYHLTVSPQHFAEQMKYIKERYRCIRFEDTWEDADEPSVVVTFDDGYADNCTCALPILEQYQVPATIFVASGNIGSKREFWWDELGRLFTCAEEYPSVFRLEDPLFGYSWETDTYEKRFELAKTIRWLLRMNTDLEVRNRWFRQIREWAGLSESGREAHRCATITQLQQLAQSKWITIGAHTVHHMSLGAMEREMQKQEIENSIKAIDHWLGFSPTVFSYPFGTRLDYNQDTMEICRELGIKKAATTIQKCWKHTDNPYEIPRKTVRDWDIDRFKQQIDSTWKEV